MSSDDARAYRQLWQRIQRQIHQLERQIEAATEPHQQGQLLRRLLKLRKLARAILHRYPTAGHGAGPD